MVVEQTWADDVALESLRNAVSALVALDGAPAGEHLNEAVERAIMDICRAIEACEQEGVDRREILAQLGAARAIHARSPFIARAQDWPQGYPGDYETIEYLCEAANRAEPGSLGYALEALALRSPITCQHRNKVAFQADAILSACNRKKDGVRILSIGCGGCRDVRSIAQPVLQAQAEFVLCDVDYEALDFTLHALGPAGGTLHVPQRHHPTCSP